METIIKNAPLNNIDKTHTVLLSLYRPVLDGARGYINFDNTILGFSTSGGICSLIVKDWPPSGVTGQLYSIVFKEEIERL
jgi:hypothetical protein